MKRSRLKNNCNSNRKYEAWCRKYEALFIKQWNLCLTLLRKTEKQHLGRLDMQDIHGKETFLKTLRPYFSDKGNKSSKITLIENNTVTDETVL